MTAKEPILEEDEEVKKILTVMSVIHKVLQIYPRPLPHVKHTAIYVPNFQIPRSPLLLKHTQTNRRWIETGDFFKIVVRRAPCRCRDDGFEIALFWQIHYGMMKSNLHLYGGIVSLVFGVIVISLYGSWFNTYFNGLGAHGPQYFNWHMLCATMSLFLFMAPATGMFRTLDSFELSYMAKKNIHAAWMTFAFAFMIAGVVIVYNFHSEMGYAHFYTVHSWLGMSFVILMGLQWVVGMITLFFGIQIAPARTTVQVHRVMGTVFLGLTAAVVASGTIEKAGGLQRKLYAGTVHANFMVLLAMLTLTVAGLVLYFKSEGRAKGQSEVAHESDPLIATQ
jgi:cytochrome b-561